VLNLCVVSTSAGSEPRATATTTTHFAGFTDGDTCGANGTDGLRRECTGLHALRPCVTSVSVARTSTVLEPRTTGGAATDLAGFLEGAALETCHHTDDWRAG